MPFPEVPLPESSAWETCAGPDHPLTLPPGEEGVEQAHFTCTEHFCPGLWAVLGVYPRLPLEQGVS